MKSLKKTLLIPIIALGSLSSCYKEPEPSSDKSNCPEQKTCPESTTCPEKTCPSEKTCPTCGSLDITFENGDVVSDTLYLQYDSNNLNLPSQSKRLVAHTNIENANITFVSNRPDVVNVTSNGLITALKADSKAKITVSVSNKIKKEFDVYTLRTRGYFIYSSNKITGCRDKDVEELILPEGFTSVSQNLLNDLPRLRKLVIPEGYTTFVRDKAPYFAESKLEELYIPSTLVTVFGFDIPLNSLKTIQVAEGNSKYKTYNDQILCFLGDTQIQIMKLYNGFDGSFTSSTLSEIQQLYGTTKSLNLYTGCGNGLNSIKHLNIPKELSITDHGGFTGSSVEVLSISRYYSSNQRPARSIRNNMINCKNLKEVRFNDEAVEGQNDVFSIVDGALYTVGGGSLILGTVSGKISESASTISYYAFCGREFENPKLKIPANITTINCEAFADTNLEKVYIPATTTIVSENHNYKNTNNYDSVYNSDLTPQRAKGGLELTLDTITAYFTNNYLGTFAFANPDLEIYDGYETDRGTNNRLTQRAVSKFTFKYSYNVSEEAFDAL